MYNTKKVANSLSVPEQKKVKTLIPSPSLDSRFASSNTIKKSPALNKRDETEVVSKFYSGESDTLKKYLENAKSSDSSASTITVTKKESTSEGQTVTRKQRNLLKKIDDTISLSNPTSKKIREDLPLTAAFKNKGEKKVEKSEKNIDNADSLSDDEEDTNLSHEGFLCKITQSKKLKKLWFRLVFRDLFCLCLN